MAIGTAPGHRLVALTGFESAELGAFRLLAITSIEPLTDSESDDRSRGGAKDRCRNFSFAFSELTADEAA
ncbi:MAG: hypothetical protein ABL908_08900 [Hyphomicrobium sp.]